MTDLELVIATSPRLRPRTKKIYLDSVREFLAFSEGELTGPVVELWRDTLATTRKAQTVNGKLSALRYASRRVAERAQNPQMDFARYAEMLKPQHSSAERRRALTVPEAARLIAACRGPRPIDLRDTAICVLGFRTGLRRAGIAGIALSDLSAGTLTVTLKGGHRHTLYLDAETQQALGPWVASLGALQGPIFRSLRNDQLGPGLTTGGLYKAVRRRARRAGIPGFHPHIFRHTFVSWAQERGIKPHRIALMTGHKSDAMIMTYTTDLEAASEPVGSLLPPLLV